MTWLLLPLAVVPALLVYGLALALMRISDRRRQTLLSYRTLARLDKHLNDVQRAPTPALQPCEAEIHE